MAQKDDFLTSFTGNRDRARILRIFMFNPTEVLTLGQLTKRAQVSTKAAQREVKALMKLGVIKEGKVTIELANGSKRRIANKRKLPAWVVNQDFKHLRAVSNFVHEVSPIKYDLLVAALRRTGRVSALILSGSFMGDASRPADLIVAADTVNERKLAAAIRSLEPAVGREIRYAAFSTPEFRYRLTVQDRLLRDTLDFPHLVLLDRTRML
jgi:DNA-binding Lrp family transcriptional regulator